MELEYCNSTVKIYYKSYFDMYNTRSKKQKEAVANVIDAENVQKPKSLKIREKRIKKNTRKNRNEKEQNIQKLSQDQNEIVEKESEDNRKRRRLKKSKDNDQENDSFMNEKSSQIKDRQKQNKSDVFKVCGQRNDQGDNEMVLVAEISDDESSSSQENQGQERAARPKQGKSKSKKKVKGKSIQIVKRKNIKQHLNEEDVIQFRNRPKERKNYQQPKISPVKQRVKLNFNVLNKEVLKMRKNENILIGSVISDGFVGPYRHFEVRLRNGEKVYIRQKEMIDFFPVKLAEYRQRILNKVSKSTSRLNFVV